MAKKAQNSVERGKIRLEGGGMESCHCKQVFAYAWSTSCTHVRVAAHISLMPAFCDHVMTVKHLDPMG